MSETQGFPAKPPHSGIHDVSSSRAKAFLRLLPDSSAQEAHCRDEEMRGGGQGPNDPQGHGFL